ncbi:MAG TPA: type IV toxin-antitoxin system AbiEi family antitoxin domain-containing protein [Acidimicrobiia bacterium]|nr:type IV toxin-antitoxin system AbiEi family antitoxin domain-containing protein [Acidimicrobiia bacterium]
MDQVVIAQRAASQHSVISWAQARALGASPQEIRHQVDVGAWERPHDGVYVIAGTRPTYEQRLVAACLAVGPEAAVSHRAAATIHGLLSYSDPPVEITTTRRRSPERDGVVVHRLADLHPRWVTDVDGVRATTVARTLVDLGAVASPRTVEAALDRASGRRLVTYREARDAMVAVARKGRTGVGTMRLLLETRVGQEHPAGVLEARMQSLLDRESLPPARSEFVVVDEHGGFVAVVDFAYPDRRLAIEVDGYEFHSSPDAFDHGHARDRLLIAEEWAVLHFGWADVERRAERVGREIRSVRHRRPLFSAR